MIVYVLYVACVIAVVAISYSLGYGAGKIKGENRILDSLRNLFGELARDYEKENGGTEK